MTKFGLTSVGVWYKHAIRCFCPCAPWVWPARLGRAVKAILLSEHRSATNVMPTFRHGRILQIQWASGNAGPVRQAQSVMGSAE